MKEITKLEVNHIVSEPGDFTRYDYIIIEHLDEYIIAPYVSTFPFPTRLLYWDIVNLNTVGDCLEFINKDDNMDIVNPHTLLEVVTTIKELYGYKYNTKE